MEKTTPKPFVFVLMPFNEKFNDIYEFGIKATCKEAGAYCERVDEQIFEERILDHIYNQIVKADIIIADMTDRNPNVFYETGYAHALGKSVILLTQKTEDIPFDLKHYVHIIYSGKIVELTKELKKSIKWSIQHPKESLSIIKPALQYYINGNLVKNDEDFIIIANRASMGIGYEFETNLQLDIFNPSDRIINGKRMPKLRILEKLLMVD